MVLFNRFREIIASLHLKFMLQILLAKDHAGDRRTFAFFAGVIYK
jgi:hypothetical protein